MYKNLIAVAPANAADMFRHIRDWLCSQNGIADYSSSGLGWTLHDSYYAVDADNISANDWFVAYSSGEGGNDDLYYQFKYTTTGLYIYGGLYFNASTNAWVSTYVNNSQVMQWSTVGSLYIYGDLNFVVCMNEVSSGTVYPCMFGCLDYRLATRTVEPTTGAVSSGSSVSIPVGDTTAEWWEAGNRLFIKDDDHIERITIISKTANSITADLSNSYASGAKLAIAFPYYCQGGTGFFGSSNRVIIAPDGSLSYYANKASVPGIASWMNPDKLNDTPVGVGVDIGYSGRGYYGSVPNVYNLYAALTHLDVHSDGTDSYRFFYGASSHYYLFREV